MINSNDISGDNFAIEDNIKPFISSFFSDISIHPMFLKIYLYILNISTSNNTSLSLDKLSKELGIFTSELRQALEFWENKNILEIFSNSRDDNCLIIKFSNLLASNIYNTSLLENDILSPSSPKSSLSNENLMKIKNSKHISDENSLFSSKTKLITLQEITDVKNNLNDELAQIIKDSPQEITIDTITNLKVNLASQPNYSPTEIDIYIERSKEIKMLFKKAEEIFAKPLTHVELNMILSFFEWYSLPIDVIIVMLQYCVDNDKQSRSYIETVARDWSERNINTVELANDYINSQGVSTKILRAFGISGKLANKKQLKYINTWLDVYNLPLDVILDCCEDIFLRSGSTSFEYADTILEDWSKSGVKTVQDADKHRKEFKEKYELEFTKSKKAKLNSFTNSNTQHKQTKFSNFKQRDTNFDEIEKLAQNKLN